MKKTSQKKKKKGSKKSKRSESRTKVALKPVETPSVSSKEEPQKKPVAAPKKVPEKKREDKGFKPGRFKVVTQFLREARQELKKVKWPTRKELLASTAMVIFLVLVISIYLGVVDFALIKILKIVVG